MPYKKKSGSGGRQMKNYLLWLIGEFICVIFSFLAPLPYNILFVVMVFFMLYGYFHSIQKSEKREVQNIEVDEDDFVYLVFQKGEIYTNMIKKPAGRYKGKNFSLTIKADEFKKAGEILN